MLLADQLTGHTHDKTAAMLEARDQNSLNSIPSPRILNSHLPFDKLVILLHGPPMLLDKTNLVRNSRGK